MASTRASNASTRRSVVEECAVRIEENRRHFLVVFGFVTVHLVFSGA
jgi:hypothetical protein